MSISYVDLTWWTAYAIGINIVLHAMIVDFKNWWRDHIKPTFLVRNLKYQVYKTQQLSAKSYVS